MKKKLFDTYTNSIWNTIHNKNTGAINENRNFSFTGEHFEKALSSDGDLIEPKTALKDLASLLGIKEIKRPFKGDHPDFAHLRNKPGVEYHHIVSMFIDVRNSTKLHYNYDLTQITKILQTIIVAATQTCALFGAHIQRIQGDGVFVYFGGKSISKLQAMKDAVNAAAFFSYFVKYELRELFEMEDINRIYTRIGIDFGDDADVMWAIFGLPGCDELTTNSLHTSMPAKMQAQAGNNGIVIGQNISDRLNDVDTYCDFFRDEKGNVDSKRRYIFQKPDGSLNYGQKDFKWESYLKNTFSFIKADEYGKLYIEDRESLQEELERKRVSELAQQTRLIQERQSIYNANTKKEVPLSPHNFHSDDYR